jgi:hypothetical protein
MQTVQLVIKEKKATTLINFLNQLDFVEIKSIAKLKRKSKKEISPDDIISATTPDANISDLFGAWNNTKIDSNKIRLASRKKEQLTW